MHLHYFFLQNQNMNSASFTLLCKFSSVKNSQKKHLRRFSEGYKRFSAKESKHHFTSDHWTMNTVLILSVLVLVVDARFMPHHKFMVEHGNKPKIQHEPSKFYHLPLSKVDLKFKASMVSENFQKSIFSNWPNTNALHF